MMLDSLLRDLGGANPYELLGLTAKATDTEIKEARRRLQRQAHPDLVDGDGDYARVINIAADLLLDPQRRAMFDSGIDSRTRPALHAAIPGRARSRCPRPTSRPGRCGPPNRPSGTSGPPGRASSTPRCGRCIWRPSRAPCSSSSARSAPAWPATRAPAWARSPRRSRLPRCRSRSGSRSRWPSGTGIRQGWRGISGAGWALTIIVLLPIGLSCGTLMSYTLTPAAASTDRQGDQLHRVPDFIEGTMIWAFPVGLIFALAAMVLISLPASRLYLETMGAVRETADQLARHRAPRPSR